MQLSEGFLTHVRYLYPSRGEDKTKMNRVSSGSAGIRIYINVTVSFKYLPIPNTSFCPLFGLVFFFIHMLPVTAQPVRTGQQDLEILKRRNFGNRVLPCLTAGVPTPRSLAELNCGSGCGTGRYICFGFYLTIGSKQTIFFGFIRTILNFS